MRSFRPDPAERRATEPRRSGFSLRLDGGRVYLRAGPERGEGFTLGELVLEVPDVSFPFDVTGGAERFRSRRCRLTTLELSLDAAAISAAQPAPGPEALAGPAKVHFGEQRCELSGALAGAEGGRFTARLGLEPEGERLRALLCDVRVHGLDVPPPALVEAELLARLAAATGGVREGNEVVLAPLGALLKRLLATRGFKLPEAGGARAGLVAFAPAGLTLRWAHGAAAPVASSDAELLAAIEGGRAFAEAEELLARGDLAAARKAWLRTGDAALVHPFAATRLLGLCLGAPDAHDEALDLAQHWRERSPALPAASWVAARILAGRGEGARAGRLWLALAERDRAAGHHAAAVEAGVEAGRAASIDDPPLAVRALSLALQLERDHLGALRLLAEAAVRAGDREAASTANRRLAAYATEPSEIARAHVRLAKLARRTTEAKLHYDQALRLLPDDPDALVGLAAVCREAGEPLRAARALSRAIELATLAHDEPAAGRLALELGELWERALGHPENALLRYREAARRRPDDVHAAIAAARVSRALGLHAEAAEHCVHVLSRLGDEVPAALREPALQAHLQLAEFAGEADAKARGAALAHLDAALALGEGRAALHLRRAALLEAEGRLDEARAALGAAHATASGDERVELGLRLARLQLARGAVAEAEELLGGLAAGEARLDETLALLASARARRGDAAGEAAARALLAERAVAGEARARALLELATAELHAGRPSHAARAARRALDDGADVEALRLLVACERASGEVDGLVDALGRLARATEALAPGAAAEARRERAALLSERGHGREAAEELARARRLMPDDGRLAALHGRALLALGRAEEALAPLEEAAARGVAREEPGLWVALAQAAEETGDVALAADALDAATRAGVDGGAVARLDRLLARLGRHDTRAERLLERAAREAEPTAAAAHAEAAARALADAGAPAGRQADAWRLAAERAPNVEDHASRLEAWATYAEAAGRRAEAAGALERLAAHVPGDREAARALCRAAELHVDPVAAARAIDEALRRDPSSAPARLARAARPERADAERLADVAAALAPGAIDPPPRVARPALHRLAAEVAARAGDAAEARRQLELLIAYEPDDLRAAARLSALMEAAGDEQARLELLLHRAELSGEWGRARCLAEAAQLAASLGRLELAGRLLARAREAGADEPRLDRLALALATTPRAHADALAALASRAADPAEAARLRLAEAAQRAALDPPGALAAACAAHALVPEDPSALERATAFARALGRTELLATLLGRAARQALLAGGPAAVRALVAAADAAESARRPDEALRLRRRALGAGPDGATAAELLRACARLEAAAGRPYAAAATLQALAAKLPAVERPALLLRAARLLEVSDPAAARRALEPALALAPDDALLRGLERSLCGALGDVAGEADALEALGRSALRAQDRPAAAEAFRRLAALAAGPLASGSREEQALRRWLEARPGDPAAERRLAALLAPRGGRWLAESVRLRRRLAAAEPIAADAARELLALVPLAELALADAPLALSLRREAAARAPSSVEAALELAQALLLRGARGEALSAVRHALACDLQSRPEERRTLLRLGADLAAETGAREDAEAWLRRLLAERPWDESAAGALSALQAVRDPAAARATLASLASALPRGPARRSLRLLLFSRAAVAGSDVDALEQLEDASAGEVDAREELAAAAEAAAAAGRHLLRAELLGRLAALQLEADAPEAAAEAHEARAEALERGGARARAEEALAQAEELLVEVAPIRAAALARRRAGRLASQGDRRGAEAAFRHAAELDPTDLDSLRAAVELCRLAGDAEGEADLLDALCARTPPGVGRARCVLRLAELFVGPLASPGRAERALQHALQLDPGNAAAEALLDALYERGDRHLELADRLQARADAAPPADAALLLSRAAELRAGAGDLPGAATAAARAAALLPEEAALQLAAADRAHHAGDLAGELTHLQRRLAIGDDPALEERLAAALERAADAAGLARLSLRRAERLPAGLRAATLLEAARRFGEAGEREARLDAEQRAFEDDPRDDAAFAAVLSRTSDPSRLDGELQRRAEAVPAEAGVLHRLRGEALFAAGRPAAALEAFEASLAASPDELTTLVSAADAAAEHAEEARAFAWDERIVALAERGVAEAAGPAARARFRRALAAEASLDPSARERLEGALRGAPDHPRAEEARDALDRLLAADGDRAALAALRLERARRTDDPAARRRLLEAADEIAPPGAERLEALRALVALSPDDGRLADRLLTALADSGAAAERCALLEARAAKLSGLEAALRLLEAARLAGERLADPARAARLRAAAREQAPEELVVLRASLPDLRAPGAGEALAAALARLLETSGDAERPALLLERARALESIGDPRALSAFRTALAAAPPGREALEAATRARRLAEQAGDPRLAAEMLETLARLERQPRRRAGLLAAAAARLELGIGDAPAAEKLLVRAHEAAPDEPGPCAALAALLARVGRRAEAADWLAKEAERLSDPEQRAERHRIRAEWLAAHGDGDAARRAWRDVVAVKPTDVSAWRALARDAAAREDRDAEHEAITALLAQHAPLAFDESAALLRRNAALLAERGRVGEAAEAWGALFDRDPADDEAWGFLRAHLAARKAWSELVRRIESRDAALAGHGARARGERRDARLELARIHVFELGDAASAERAYRAVLELDPKNRSALAALRELAERAGDSRSVAVALEGELAAEPPPPPELASGAWLKLARLRETRLVDPAGAADAYAAARAAAGASGQPGVQAEAERGLARSCLAAGRPAEALRAAEARLQDPKDEGDLELRRLALDAADAAHEDGALREHLAAALALAPADEALLARLEGLAREDGPIALAAALERRAVHASDPARRVEALLRLAAIRADELGDPEGCERALRDALALSPGDDDAFARLRLLLERAGRHADRLELLRLRGRKAPRPSDRARALLEQGELLRGPLRDGRRAADAFERALGVDPGLLAALEALVEVQLELGRDEAAEPLLRRLRDQGGGSTGLFFCTFRLGELLERRGRYDEALPLLLDAASRNPSFLPAHHACARVAESLGRPDEALAAWHAMVDELDPVEFAEQAAQAWRAIADVHRRRQRDPEQIRALEQVVALEPNDRDANDRLVALLIAAGVFRDAERALVRLAGSGTDPERLDAAIRLGELRLDRLADMEGALAALEQARALDPDEPRALRRLLEIYAGAGRAAELVDVAERLEARGEGERLDEHLVPLGRALRLLGEPERAFETLWRGLTLSPADVALAHEVRDLGHSLGRLREYAILEERLADEEAAANPAHAAQRLRSLAALARDRFREPARALALLRKAQSLVPESEDDRRATLQLLAASRDTASEAVEGFARIVKAQPTDASAVRSLADACEASGDGERARWLHALATGLSPGPLSGPPVPADTGGAHLGVELRERLLPVAARRPLARLLRALAPALEPLFPSDLTRLGVTAADRVSRTHAPGVAARAMSLSSCLTDRDLAVYLAPGGGTDAIAENTRPPSLVVGLRALTALPPAGLAFLLARGIELASSGYGLVGKFPPHDLAILCAIACRWFDRTVEVPGLQAPKVEPYLMALDRFAPEGQKAALAPLAAQARAELAGFDPRAMALGFRCAATRVGALVTGDPGAALDTLVRLDRRFADVPPERLDRAAAVAGNPELADLVQFAEREDLTALRAAAGLL